MARTLAAQSAYDKLEADKLAAEIRKLTAEATEAEAKAAVALAELRDTQASANHARIYPFMSDVNSGSVRTCIATLETWSRREPEAPMSIVFNSPGGSVIDGLALYDAIDDLKRKGHRITTVARGMVASMGGILLQAGDERVIGINCHVLIHELSTMSVGKMSELEDEREFCNRLQDRCFVILAERSTLTAAKIKSRAKRKDWWLGADLAIEYGFADRLG